MQEQVERWELRSGTWIRDRASETWRLAASRDGMAVDPRLPVHDVARLVGARRETVSGEWFPPDFNYSQQTGVPLRVNLPTLDSPWVPPFGASALSGAKPLARGLRQTALPLAVERAQGRSADAPPDRALPPLPAGPWRFVVDRFDVACPTLMAIEPEQGSLFMLLPESKSWIQLERTAGASWGQRLRNPRGWRMELVHDHGHATAYCPCATGVAAITASAIGLCCAVEHAGEGPAIGGPVAWGGEIWIPVLGKGHVVHLVGKPHASAGHIVLPTHAPVPQHGFEAPVFDEQHVNWPCDEGQLVLRHGPGAEKQCDWLAWPEGAQPVFAMGGPYLSPLGTFWQLCRTSVDGQGDGHFEFVRMASAKPEAAPLDALRLCAGRASYRGTLRIDGDPWRAVPAADEASTEIVAPLLESAHDGAVVGLRMEAPHGALALLHGRNEPRRAVLQVERPGRPATPLGALEVKRPWLALPFVHQGHLWITHADLPQAIGWKLGP